MFIGTEESILGINDFFRGLIHRIAAVLLILLSLWHLIELGLLKSGRQFFAAFLLKFSDFKFFVRTMKYSIFSGNEKPLHPRFDYTEKVEYWALIWGTIVMVLSGFILWFPEWFSQFNWLWLIKVAEVFHYYEAWLATLAILVWHFFFVLYHPKEYPMALTWLHGRMSIHEYKEKHFEDYVQIMEEVEAVKKGELEIDECSFQASEYVKRHRLEQQ